MRRGAAVCASARRGADDLKKRANAPAGAAGWAVAQTRRRARPAAAPGRDQRATTPPLLLVGERPRRPLTRPSMLCRLLSWSEQGIQEYNGGAVLGMAGKNCVAVACDMRYGAQMQTMAIDKNKVFKMHDR